MLTVAGMASQPGGVIELRSDVDIVSGTDECVASEKRSRFLRRVIATEVAARSSPHRTSDP